MAHKLSFLLCSFFIMIFISSCRNDPNESGKAGRPSAETLRICAGTSYSILPIIADEKGMFSKEGLKVEIVPFPIGRDAMEAMFAGRCDVALRQIPPSQILEGSAMICA